MPERQLRAADSSGEAARERIVPHVNPREVTDLPYEERRIIVVAEKVPSAVAKPRFGDWDVAKAGAVAMLGGGALGLAGVALVRA
uniref:hypothetical protein n=1 Tax=uncultured Paracoccus sp. TaxID=189685 RepID=UPI003519F182